MSHPKTNIDAIIEKIKQSGVGVMATDTIYGLVGSAFSKEAVQKIYLIKKRDPTKPLIVLIRELENLDLFGIHPDGETKKILSRIWPNPVSVILPCPDDRLSYLHRGEKSLAFRLPADQPLRNLINSTGPLVAPSANPEGQPPALDINQAKKYFGQEVDFYLDSGRLEKLPSTLVRVNQGQVTVLRQGQTKVD